MKARTLILNYNGKDLLRKFLPSFQKAVVHSREGCALTVIDNCSADGSVEMLRAEFPDVDVFKASQNRVLCTYNEAASFYSEDVLIFMNNDIDVEPDFVDPLVRPFGRAADVFFVTPKVLAMDHKTYEGNRTKAWVRFGVFGSSARFPGYEKGIDAPGLTFQGGFGAVDRKKFLELGGYDDLYLPGRLEDADICFHAYKRGWRCLYEPHSVVYHEGGTSFHRRFGQSRTLVINWRNTFLFMWKNLSAKIVFFEFLPWLPARLLYSLLRGQAEFAAGFFQALPLLGRALERRRRMGPAAPSDERIFEMSCEI